MDNNNSGNGGGIDRKAVRRNTYVKRKECIKKKTMELATLCDIDACTIIKGPDGEFDTWPEDPVAARAIIKNFKDSTGKGLKRIRIQDEEGNIKTVAPDGKVESWPAILKNIRDSSSLGLKRRRMLDEARKNKTEFLKELDSKLKTLTERIELLRRRVEERAPPFMFDLNHPPPDQGDESPSAQHSAYEFPSAQQSADFDVQHSSQSSGVRKEPCK